ncbi:MAG: hypothetical protein OJF51_003814 [Nitrospira sp.]|jgi:hypothetical protein|nr:MAG: hypothetical protein OJF51_003814 [Nitrospira sp.]
MREAFEDQGGLFSYISLEERVPDGHPLRKIREYVRAMLADMDWTFSRMYATDDRSSVVERTFFRGRDVDRGWGQPQKLQTKRRFRGRRRRRELSRPEAKKHRGPACVA